VIGCCAQLGRERHQVGRGGAQTFIPFLAKFGIHGVFVYLFILDFWILWEYFLFRNSEILAKIQEQTVEVEIVDRLPARAGFSVPLHRRKPPKK
jgi:hypothetical protein